MTLADAAEMFVAACTQPDELPLALQQLALAAGAESATLVHGYGPFTQRVVPSANLADRFRGYEEEGRPRDPRAARVNPTLAEGFRVDQDDFTFEEIGRDPFYQDFLRPRDVYWHACALVAEMPGGEAVHLGLKRPFSAGPFDQEALRPITAALPLLRAAARLLHVVDCLVPAADRLVGDIDRTIFGISREGEAWLLRQGPAVEVLVELRGTRLLAAEPAVQARIDAAVLQACRDGRPSASLLVDRRGRRWSLRLVPALAGGRGWLSPFAAWALLTDLDAAEIIDDEHLMLLARFFGLSRAEARVAMRVAQGASVQQISHETHASVGTVRNHLKAIFLKTGAARQVELAALVARL